MPQRWTLYNRLKQTRTDNLHKLLGDLEVEIMERMWQREAEAGEASGEQAQVTVREIATDLQKSRQIAYTTVMTVMGNLAEKGLLERRSLDRKTHLYRVALSREEYLERASRQMVDTLVEDFGELAIAQFVEVVEQVDPELLERLLARAAEVKARTTTSFETRATSGSASQAAGQEPTPARGVSAGDREGQP